MSAYVRAAAAVLISTGVLAGCGTTTTGTLAQTTEPGPPLSTSRTPSSSRPTATALPTLPSLPFPTPHDPTVPAPANSLTMTCKDYAGLDEETQLAVVFAIAEQPNSLFNRESAALAKTLADAMCKLVPSATVNDVVMGGGLPK